MLISRSDNGLERFHRCSSRSCEFAVPWSCILACCMPTSSSLPYSVFRSAYIYTFQAPLVYEVIYLYSEDESKHFRPVLACT